MDNRIRDRVEVWGVYYTCFLVIKTISHGDSLKWAMSNQTEQRILEIMLPFQDCCGNWMTSSTATPSCGARGTAGIEVMVANTAAMMVALVNESASCLFESYFLEGRKTTTAPHHSMLCSCLAVKWKFFPESSGLFREWHSGQSASQRIPPSSLSRVLGGWLRQPRLAFKVFLNPHSSLRVYGEQIQAKVTGKGKGMKWAMSWPRSSGPELCRLLSFVRIACGFLPESSSPALLNPCHDMHTPAF